MTLGAITLPRSAGLKPAVSPICNRRRVNWLMAVELFTPRGLQIRDTADCKSALLWLRPRRAVNQHHRGFNLPFGNVPICFE